MRAERILLLQLKRIGDFILTAPAVAACRAANPGAEIVAVVPAPVLDLASCLTGLTRALPWRARAANAKTVATVAAGSWDVCLDFAGTDRSAFLAALSRAGERISWAKFAGSRAKKLAYTRLCGASVRDLHTVDFHLMLVRELWPGASAGLGFALPRAMADWAAAEHPIAPVIVHPGTARAEKYWMPERWAEVISHLAREIGAPVLITGSGDRDEQEHIAAIKSRLTVPVADLSGRLSLLQTAAVIGRSCIALGVDSMAMHLAAMLGRPQVVLYGPTNPHHWRPRHEHALVVAAGHDGPLAVTDPRAAGAEMKLISTGQVMDAIGRLRSHVLL